MPAKRHTNHMKATIWAPTMRSDCSGTPAGVIAHAFHALNGRPKTRAALMEELKTLAAEFTDYEARNPDCLKETPQ